MARYSRRLTPKTITPASPPRTTLVITSTQLLLAMFRDHQPLGAGLAILVAFDAIYLTASWLVFEWVLEP